MSENPQENDENSLSNPSLYEILKNCVQLQSYESLDNNPIVEDFNDDAWSVCDTFYDYSSKMISTNSYSTSGNISAASSYASDNSFGDNILEENGRISLAYENLRTIPRKIADKFAAQTKEKLKILDLSYNNFQNLAFLTYFEDLHTLILDRNTQLDPNTLPYLPNLEILWLNNCNITKITDWLQRIQKQCPALRHLSIMGNPGLKDVFNYCILHRDFLPLHHQSTPPPPPSPSTSPINCRDYILDMLPNLEYLDGVPRTNKPTTVNFITTNGKGLGSSSTNNSPANGSSISDHKELNGRRQVQISPTLSFKDLFQLKRRKKSYQSSSTN